MNEVVLDASAIVAVLDREPGHEKLTLDILSRAIASAVNVAEVQMVLVNRGMAPEDAWRNACSPLREIADFTAEQARIAGTLVNQTRSLGLSLGDRACLALGIRMSAPVYTADRAWKKLRPGIEVRLLR
ncbi:MAG TPA: type II toxin-antitoxin system VapC family toxin [Terracidiphilus sp.]